MADAMLCSRAVVAQELAVRLRSGGDSGKGGVFPYLGTQIRARQCSSCTRVSVPGSNCSSAGNGSGSIRILSCGWSGKCRRRVEAGVSQARASLLSSSQHNGVLENGRMDRTIPTSLDGVKAVQDSSSCNGKSYLSGKAEDGLSTLEDRTGVLDVSIRDLKVIRERLGAVEPMQNPESKAGIGELMENKPDNREESGPVVKAGDTDGHAVQETGKTLHLKKKSGVLETLAGDVEVMQDGISSAGKNLQVLFPLTKHEAKARVSSAKLHCAEEGYHDSEFQSRKDSEPGKRKEGLMYWGRLKGFLLQAGDLVGKWAEGVGKRTGVDKIILRDVKFTRDAMSSVQEGVLEALRMRGWEDASIAVESSPAWPEPAYSGLSGMDLLAADVEALKSYANYFRGFVNTWRIPLQLAYDPETVASYFNRRPHLLLLRFLEVSAAFKGVALQLFLDRARVRRNRSPSSIGEGNGGLSTLMDAEALKQTLVRLGPTFIKVAQSLSSRPDLIGVETAKVLSELQDRLSPFPTEEAMAVIEVELGVPAAQVFSFLSASPVAAASFGQVFRGRTVEGEEVAVKVQRPHLLFDVALDIYVLRLGLGILRKVAKINSDISVLADELGYGLFGELDYTLEATNAREFGALVGHLSYVRVPRTLPHLTRKRVLTMEWITGYRPLDLQLIAEGNSSNEKVLSGISRREAKIYLDDLVRKGVECSLVQLLETGVMHADPHPGNLLYTKEGTLVYLDFGLLAHVSKKHRAAMVAVIAHLVNAEWRCLANDFADLDILKPSTDRFALRLALEKAFGEGPEAVVKNGVPDIQFGQITGKLWKIGLQFRFRLPAYYTLVLRALASLEGIAVSVDPDYKVFAAAYPYVLRRLLSDNSHPNRQVLQSLVLTQSKEFRWARIAEIMATSRGGRSLDSVVPRATPPPAAADLPGPHPRKLSDGNALALVLLSFTLSKEGRSVRRVLLEANTESLAKAFISPTARSLRRQVAFALSESFYRSMPTFNDKTGFGWTTISTGAGQGTGRTTDSFTEEPQHDLSRPRIQSVVDVEKISMESSLISHRLWFLLKVLTSRLRSAPILMLRVSWTIVTMVVGAAALALHKYVISLSDRLFSAKINRLAGILPRTIHGHAYLELQGDSVNAV